MSMDLVMTSRSRRRGGYGCKESCHGHCLPPHSVKCLCLYLLLSLILLVIVAAVLLVVFVTRLKKPTFYLQSVQMDRSFSLRSSSSNRSGDNATSSCSVASLLFAAQNPNGLGIRYSAADLAVDTFVQHNLYPLLINCLIEGDEEISAIVLDAIKRLAEIPKGTDIIFPPDGQGLQLNKVAAQSSSMARIRILSLIAKLFAASSCTATAIRDSNLLSLFEDEIKDRKDMLKTLSALEVLYELAEHPHSNMFLLKTSLLQHITDVINDPSADSIVRSRASLISGRLLASADAFMTIEQSCVTNLLLAIDKILRTEESQNTDEIESALETLGLIGTTSQGACLLFSDPPNVAKHVVEMSFDRQGRGKQLAALHAFGSICGVDREEDQMKLDDYQAEECLKRLVYSAASNSPKLTPSALLLSILQQDPDVRIAGYRVLSGLVVREWCLREVCSKPEIIGVVTDPKMETTKLGMEARYACCVAINKALASSHLLHEPSLSELIGKLNEAVRRGPYLSQKKPRVEAQPVVGTMERF